MTGEAIPCALETLRKMAHLLGGRCGAIWAVPQPEPGEFLTEPSSWAHEKGPINETLGPGGGRAPCLQRDSVW